MVKTRVIAVLCVVIGVLAAQDKTEKKFSVVPFKSQKFAAGLSRDSTARQKKWLAELRSNDAVAFTAKPVWQGNIDWSIQDRGFVEGDIQKEWQRLGIWNVCLWAPGAQGRVTAMQIAIKEAKAGNCKRAFEITVSTQLHNPPAANTIRSAGVDGVCAYLKEKP